jgi:hypothetical protein
MWRTGHGIASTAAGPGEWDLSLRLLVRALRAPAVGLPSRRRSVPDIGRLTRSGRNGPGAGTWASAGSIWNRCRTAQLCRFLRCRAEVVGWRSHVAAECVGQRQYGAPDLDRQGSAVPQLVRGGVQDVRDLAGDSAVGDSGVFAHQFADDVQRPGLLVLRCPDGSCPVVPAVATHAQPPQVVYSCRCGGSAAPLTIPA